MEEEIMFIQRAVWWIALIGAVAAALMISQRYSSILSNIWSYHTTSTLSGVELLLFGYLLTTLIANSCYVMEGVVRFITRQSA